MIRAHCPRHGHAVLLPASRIRSVDSSERGHVVRWTCTCGALGTTTLPGRVNGV